jgi:hypothetical protein
MATTSLTRNAVAAELRRLKAQGWSIQQESLRARHPALRRKIKRVFDTYAEAIWFARLGPRPSPPTTPFWNRDRIIQQLRARRTKGQDVSVAALQKGDLPLSGAIYRYFKSHDAALTAAGIDPASVRRHMRWSKKLILQRLAELRAQGRNVATGALQKSNNKLALAIFQHFGSHDAALRAAGIDPLTVRRYRVWTKKDVVAELRLRHRKGEPMNSSYLATHVRPLYGALQRHFGGFTNAVRAAGIDPLSVVCRSGPGSKSMRFWTQKLVLARLKERHAGRQDLRYETMRRKHHALFWAARELFGSYQDAVRAAGIDYWKMSQMQLARQRRRLKRAGNADRDEPRRAYSRSKPDVSDIPR